jgi:hypothetical protein
VALPGRSSQEKSLVCGNNGKYGKYGIGLKRFHGKEMTGRDRAKERSSQFANSTAYRC